MFQMENVLQSQKQNIFPLLQNMFLTKKVFPGPFLICSFAKNCNKKSLSKESDS